MSELKKGFEKTNDIESNFDAKNNWTSDSTRINETGKIFNQNVNYTKYL